MFGVHYNTKFFRQRQSTGTIDHEGRLNGVWNACKGPATVTVYRVQVKSISEVLASG